MVTSPAGAQADSEGAHLVLYDGVCGLCTRLLQFLLKHDHRAVFSFAPLQSATGKAMVARSGGSPEELTSFYVVANYRAPGARAFTRSDAVLFVAGELGWPWKAARVGRLLPKRLRDLLYNVVARTRYSVFGRYDQCAAPRPEFRRRFIS